MGWYQGPNRKTQTMLFFFYPFTLDLACGTCTFIKNILLFFLLNDELPSIFT